MADSFRVTLAQLDPTVGDIEGNAAKAMQAWQEGRDAGSDLVALPEMFLTGYQTQDLVLKPTFHQTAMSVLDRLVADTADGPMLAIGSPFADADGLWNTYAVCGGGRLLHRQRKHVLPNFNVFDEVRLFRPGRPDAVLQTDGPVIGTPICEDAWHATVSLALAGLGAQVLLVPNGSPYFHGKLAFRMAEMVARVAETGKPLIYLNMVGGQDDQIFDGASFVLDASGQVVAQLPAFDEAVVHLDLHRDEGGDWGPVRGDLTPQPDPLEQDWRAVVEATRSYFAKTGFKTALLGLSGGVDSAAVAAIAADALGPENVRCVMLPSEYTSAHSLEDAAGVAEALGCQLDTVEIDGPRKAVTEALAPLFAGYDEDLTEENIQSRLRGLLLMAQSNKFGEMLLTTGNKSEVAVGYATIYGDMSGGYNPLKDMYKTKVFAVCRWRNAHHRPWMRAPAGVVIPPRVIDKPPTAELRADQKDEDSLPPYSILDGILTLLVDHEASVADCVAAGYDADTVRKIEHLIYISEYKRFQSAPGPRLSQKAFWLDRRYPIVNRWRDRETIVLAR